MISPLSGNSLRGCHLRRETGNMLLHEHAGHCRLLGQARPMKHLTGRPLLSAKGLGKACLSARRAAAQAEGVSVQEAQGHGSIDSLPPLVPLDGVRPSHYCILTVLLSRPCATCVAKPILFQCLPETPASHKEECNLECGVVAGRRRRVCKRSLL